ncbi:hypothetical protein OKW96_13075 [Sphingobacterium sp. KU25419]|nr:hypothetical protein OKW96_13075 [Sphingobacterium sp. KU25419]
MATATNSLHDFGVETDLDQHFKDAVLRLNYKLEEAEGVTVHYALYDSKNSLVPESEQQFVVNKGHNSNSFPIANPLKWDAEHPNLIVLMLKLKKTVMIRTRLVRRLDFVKSRLLKTRCL